jgi:2-polyprenyl-3-methyl-5-hydroxy-6-metoxy-1,4-benzoquinol methylase
LQCGSTACERRASSSDREYKTSDARYTFFTCRACGVVFIDPVPAGLLGIIYPANYYSYTSLSESWMFRLKSWLDRRRSRRILSHLSASALSLLDVGGGYGYNLTHARAADARIARTVVVDLDESAAGKAIAAGHEYVRSPFERYETDERFDLVFLSNIIEHVANPGALLAKAFALTKPGGIAVLQTPSIEGLDARLFASGGWGGYHCPRHWVLFNERNLADLARRTGYEIVESRYTQAAAFWALSALFVLEDAGVVRITAERPAMFHPMFTPLAAAFAAFDFLRLAIGMKTSQMVFVLRKPAGR